MKKSQLDVSKIRYSDLDTLRAQYTTTPGVRKLDQHCLCSHIPSEEQPFRVARAQESDKLKVLISKSPRRDGFKLSCPANDWKSFPSGQAAEAHIVGGGSCLVEGIAGVGKTSFVRGCIERIARNSDKKIVILSKTHLASSRVNGHTADAWCRKHILSGTPKCDIVWLEEIGQLDIGLWAQLGKLAFMHKHIQVVCTGDRFQFPPIANAWRSCTVDDEALWRSDFLFDLVGGCRFELTECMRSDKALFEAYNCLIGREVDLPLVIADYRQRFPLKEEPTAHHLTISHDARIKLNRSENLRLRPPEARFIKVKGSATVRCAAQSFYIWPGMTLLGCVGRPRRGIKNSCLYTVKECEELITFVEIPGEFTEEEVKADLRLSNCQTYASCQGTEFNASLTLHELGHPRFTSRHLYVGLSRARAADMVCCA